MRPFRILLLSLACSAALAAQAQTTAPATIDLPAGDLVAALDTLARQTGAQFVYRADQLRGLRSAGVSGAHSPNEALDQLLRGSGFVAQRDASGAVVIVKQSTAPATPQASRPAPAATPVSGATDAPAVQELQTVEVTGSRIARAQVEGPAPVTVITAADIAAGGFTSVPDVMQSLTQNGGQTQSQQSAGAADFSPGAQQVDLRALGPNHTLVLVNGRRIADFPLPFGGRSNFTDVSSLPLGMIDRIEVLTGSASAIYGSDAISGVVNFILKRKVDGTTVDYRYGQTGEGDGKSHRLNLSSGFERGNFSLVAGLEYRRQDPLWGFERSQQDSSFDAPTANSQLPSRNFLVTDWWDDYIDPGEDTCAAMSNLADGTMAYHERPRYGYYCGSDRNVAYRTMISKRDGINTYASMSYLFDNGSEWFADVQAGRHELSLFRAPRSWALMTPDGVEHDYFYNSFGGDQDDERYNLQYWQRIFTPEEMGGLRSGMVNTVQKTFSLTTGFKGTIWSDWDYEASLSHSQYTARISWPQIVAEKANELFLGPLLGYTDSGYPIYNADPQRLWTPLTSEEYDSIFARTTYRPESESQTLALTLTQAELFELPGGKAGFAVTTELGRQSYDINPDPLATQYYYYSWKDSDGHGSRNRWALAGELRMPVLDTLNLSVAGRYDRYRFAGRSIGKATWSTGIEWRPLESLLVRGSYGTAFRAPDLHYVFAGPGNDETSARDYYRCAAEQPDVALDDCDWESEGIIRSRDGNADLEPETSDSWTAGFVWSPAEWFDLSVDYFDIDMRNQVQDLRQNDVMLAERDCRLGINDADPNSAYCADMVSRVTRLADGSLYSVRVNPINIARETTSGIDATAGLRWQTPIGRISLSLNHTWVRSHEIQEYPDEAVVDMFAINSGYDIPRTKTSARLGWSKGDWSTSLRMNRIGRLPNDDSYYEIYDPEDGNSPWIPATYRYTLNIGYDVTEDSQLSFTVYNLFDKDPPYDATATGYPYYDVAWFDTEGRGFYLQYTHKFGAR